MIVEDDAYQPFDILRVTDDIVVGQLLFAFVQPTRWVSDQHRRTAELNEESVSRCSSILPEQSVDDQRVANAISRSDLKMK